MPKLNPSDKRVFVIASADARRASYFSEMVTQHIRNSIVFTSIDGFEALFKMENSPPHVLITDADLPKLSGYELSEKILAHAKLNETSIIIVSPIPENEQFVDQVVTGQVQFLSEIEDAQIFSACLTKALNRLVDHSNFTYRLKFLAPGEILFHEGDAANSVFIVRKGELQAFKGTSIAPTVFGKIGVGEFVGEMAHINKEPRSATVEAITDSELIEIPSGTLDMILFTKPAWMKALMETLSRRLKRSQS